MISSATDPYLRRQQNLVAASAMGSHIEAGTTFAFAYNNMANMSPSDAYGTTRVRITNISFEFAKPGNVETGTTAPGDKIVLEIDKRYLSRHRLAAIIYTHGVGWRAHGETPDGIDPEPIEACAISIEFPGPEIEE